MPYCFWTFGHYPGEADAVSMLAMLFSLKNVPNFEESAELYLIEGGAGQVLLILDSNLKLHVALGEGKCLMERS